MIPEVYESVKARLELAESMVAALKADALDKPATPEAISLWQEEVADCHAELAGMTEHKPMEKPE